MDAPLCLTCQLNMDTPAPGGIIYDDGVWRVEHTLPPVPLVGWLIVKTLRHTESLADLEPEEAARLGPLLVACARGLTDLLGATKVYTSLYAEAPGFAHVHIHVIPRTPDLPAEHRGPSVFKLLTTARPDAESETQAVALAQDMRTFLSSTDQSPTTTEPDWLHWTRRLQAISQTGIRYTSDPAFAESPFDVQRYTEVGTIAAEMLAATTSTPVPDIHSLLDGEQGDATPKVDVRGVVIADGRVLLVRELADDGRWTLPGGWAEVGESPSRAAEREVLEESGYLVRTTKLLACLDRDVHHPPGLFATYKLFFLCDLVGGAPTGSLETADAMLFAEGELPELSEARVTEQQIRRFFEHARNPSLATDFD